MIMQIRRGILLVVVFLFIFEATLNSRGAASDQTNSILQSNANPAKQYELGEKFYNATNYSEALEWYRKAADQGNADAQNGLGFMYANGSGVAKDAVEAVKWYRKAVDQGNANAENNLALMYENGSGVSKDPVEAAKWYRKAADQGNVWGQNNLGLMYANGSGVAKDPVEAVKWYRKAAEQGNADAQDNLGVMYDYGSGVGQDPVEAVKWYRKAADQGNANAQFSLGVMYYQGNGVSKDLDEAEKWSRKAADQGNANAQNNVAALAGRQIMFLNSGEALKGQKSMAVDAAVEEGDTGFFPSLSALQDSIKSQLRQNGITIVLPTENPTPPTLKLWVRKIRYSFAGRGFAINEGTVYCFSLNYLQIIPLQTPVAGKKFIQATVWSEDCIGLAPPLVITGDANSGVTRLTSDFIEACQNANKGK